MDETVTRRCGLKARRLAKGGHRPGSGQLNHKQAVRIRRLIIERMPDQLAMPFYLWTRESVAQLIKREDGITASTWTAGRYLKSWGMDVQMPVRRAYERNDAAIESWLNEDYPQTAKEAKREKATIYCGDETDLRSDQVSGGSFALKGEAPVVERPANGSLQHDFGDHQPRRADLHGLRWDVQECDVHRIQKRFLRQAARKTYLIVDGHRVHGPVGVKQFVADNAERLRLMRLPGYCPEVNPTNC